MGASPELLRALKLKKALILANPERISGMYMKDKLEKPTYLIKVEELLSA